MREYPHRLMCVLMTDVVRSTALRVADEQAGARDLDRHYEIGFEVVAAHGGIVAEGCLEGDNLVATFPDPVAALRAAHEFHGKLASERWPIMPVRVRAAVHSGVFLLRPSGDPSGVEMHRAARLRALAGEEMVLVSRGLQEAVEGRLPKGWALTDLGLAELAGFPRPEPVAGLIAQGLRTPTLPKEHLVQSRPSALRLIGRTSECREVRRLLRENKLVTLVGPGGVGKSRLAQAVAGDCTTIELAGLPAGSDVMPAFAIALGAPSPDVQKMVEVLSSASLLVVDNCEHVLASVAPLVGDILAGAPSLTVLATSRHPLELPYEAVFPVRPLGFDGPESDAVELFLDRARLASPKFAPSDHDLLEVARLVGELEGVPLAIELLAPFVSSVPVAAIRQRRRDLKPATRGAHPRQRTVEEAVQASLALVGDQARALFARLGLFRGGWTLEAAETVGAFAPLDGSNTLLAQIELVAHSLVQFEESGRFSMLEPVRELATDMLSGAELEQVHGRFVDWFASRAQVVGSELIAGDQARALAEIDADRINYLEAHAIALRVPDRAEAGLRLAIGLAPYWQIRGMAGVGHGLLEASLTGNGYGKELRAQAETRCGILAMYAQRYPIARERLIAALHQSAELGRDSDVAAIRGNLGVMAIQLGDHAEAAEHLAEAVKVLRDMGDQVRLASALLNWSIAERRLDRLEQAEAILRECVEIALATDNTWLLAMAWHNLGGVLLPLGRPLEAEQAALKSREAWKATGDHHRLSLALHLHALALALQGRMEEAAKEWTHLRQNIATHGMPTGFNAEPEPGLERMLREALGDRLDVLDYDETRLIDDPSNERCEAARPSES